MVLKRNTYTVRFSLIVLNEHLKVNLSEYFPVCRIYRIMLVIFG